MVVSKGRVTLGLPYTPGIRVTAPATSKPPILTFIADSSGFRSIASSINIVAS